MLKFIRGKASHANAERVKLQKELFAFNKTVPHGFPNHPSALAHDSKLGLLAIGTKNGLIRVYGTPGVEFHSQLDNEAEIRQLLFVENRAQLICLCSDSSLHLWEINSKENENKINCGELENVKTCDYFSKEASKEGSLKQITIISINSNNDLLLVGTQSGNTYLLDLENFDLTDQIIYQDVVLQNIPDDYKFNPGSVEVISEQPLNSNKFLIGYNRGLLVLWDNKTHTAEHYYEANQQLESVDWLHNGEQFISSHNDGSYIVWRTSDNLQPSEQPKTPYGPFPCKAINKVVWKTVQNSDDFIIFSGGMPRASYNDKNTVSIIQGTPESGKHHVLDFTSKVIDFEVVALRTSEKDADNPTTLIVLVEEEIVLIDLTDPDWLQYKLPYLSSVHSSAITCCQHYGGLSDELFNKVIEAGNAQNAGKFTSKQWPIQGGKIGTKSYEKGNDLLITGHEDGSVRFWDASTVSMQHLYTLTTSKFFLLSDDDIALIDSDETVLNETNAEDEWPPFRKVGTFDPYSDDPRFAIRKILLCIYNNTLVIAGTAGQVIVFELKNETVEKALTTVQLNIVVDKDGFVWKGHSQLTPKNGKIKIDSGYQPLSIVQLQPPAAVTAVALYSEWGLIAAGTAHGFGIFDYLLGKVITSKTTLNPNDLASVSGGDALISRRKSFKKSLRESFRRLRKGRSQRGAKKTEGASPSSTPASSSSPTKSLDDGRKSPKAGLETIEAKPVERQIEARSPEDSMGSMVRCLYFAPAFIVNNTTQTPTLWAGTNAGTVFIFAITIPLDEKRNSDEIVCQLAKEIQLKHRAPVVAIQIIDSNGNPLPDSYDVKKGGVKAASGPGHRILIVSEEQFKLFNLPNLKPLNKFKLTAHEGARARRVGIANFVSKSNDSYSEYCVLCLSNQGDIGVFTIPDLKRQLQIQCTKREDINGISTLVFTKQGEGFYLHSSSEFRRFSLSARRIVLPVCDVELPEGARPVKPIETRPPIAAATIAENPVEEKNAEEEEEARNDSQKDMISEETPTSGIEESPVNDNEFNPPQINYSTLPNNSEVEKVVVNGVENTIETITQITIETKNHEEIHLNGNSNEAEMDSDIEVNGDNDESHLNESSIDKSNMDITVDSVKDHLANLSVSVDNDKSEVKKMPSPVRNESVPIINSHED